jgi:ABC-type multidrug transport system fused ATPase/permease subunit
MVIFSLFSRFKKGIILALVLVLIENVAWILEPTLFGNLIDVLNDYRVGNITNVDLFALSAWVGIFLLNSGVGSLRRSVDQRIYLPMFTYIATDVSKLGIAQNLSVSKTTGRAELTREFINFFQYRLPDLLEQSISIIGAITALFFFDYRIACACLIIVPPLFLMSRLYVNKVSQYQREVHDSREEAYEIFSQNDPEKVKAFYTAMAHPQIKISDWGAINFGTMRIFLLFIFLIVLYISLDLDEFTTGNIYSIVAYLWTFVTSSEYLPELLESSTAMRDISRRIRTEEL